MKKQKAKLIPQGNLIFEHHLESRYNDFLDDLYGEISIAGLKYSTSDAQKQIDPTAYRCGFNDWLDSELENEYIFEHDGEYYDEQPIEEEESA